MGLEEVSLQAGRSVECLAAALADVRLAPVFPAELLSYSPET